MMRITRKAEFSASHSCYNKRLSPQENFELYGEVEGSHGHGHNFVLEVTVEGEPDERTGMIMDLKVLKELIQAEIVDLMDHRHLNFEVPPFERVVPTTENLTRFIFDRLCPLVSKTPGVALQSVRLYETPDLYVDYGGSR